MQIYDFSIIFRITGTVQKCHWKNTMMMHYKVSTFKIKRTCNTSNTQHFLFSNLHIHHAAMQYHDAFSHVHYMFRRYFVFAFVWVSKILGGVLIIRLFKCQKYGGYVCVQYKHDHVFAIFSISSQPRRPLNENTI